MPSDCRECRRAYEPHLACSVARDPHGGVTLAGRWAKEYTGLTPEGHRRVMGHPPACPGFEAAEPGACVQCRGRGVVGRLRAGSNAPGMLPRFVLETCACRTLRLETEMPTCPYCRVEYAAPSPPAEMTITCGCGVVFRTKPRMTVTFDNERVVH